MPDKHQKKGKTRLDKYYHLAKEHGFRARSAFKLVQLNKKYDFLSSSHCVIDLCAAPGGWLQVCAKYMPAESTIVGIDLVAIKPIRNVVTLKEDITTAKCRSELKNILKKQLADVVMHDGSPNVGANWFKDAYSQSELTLASLKLAVEFMRPGGMFITKIFRSQDYTALLWVFNQLFSKVEATKPPASRSTSAEIYAVCSGYLNPSKTDPKLFDPSHVFAAAPSISTDNLKSLSSTLTEPINIFNAPEKRIRSRGGYTDDAKQVLFDTCSVATFIKSGHDGIRILGSVHALVFDESSKSFLDHDATTAEIKALCSDLKVLGKSDFKSIMKWRQKLLNSVVDVSSKIETTHNDAFFVKNSSLDKKEKDLMVAEKELDEFETSLLKSTRREKKKKSELRAKLRQRMADKKTEIDEAEMITQSSGGTGVFALDTIDSNDVLTDLLDNQDAPIDEYDSENSVYASYSGVDIDFSDSDKYLIDRELDIDAAYTEYRNRHNMKDIKTVKLGLPDDSMEVDEESKTDLISKSSGNKKSKNPLLVSIEDNVPESSIVSRWFDKDVFAGLDENISRVSKSRKLNTAEIVGIKEMPLPIDFKTKTKAKKPVRKASKMDEDEDASKKGQISFEEVPADNSDNEGELDENAIAETLAIGNEFLKKKRKAEIIDAAYNRYSYDDPADLPSWFIEEEKQHNVAQLPVTKAQVDYFKAQFAAINNRPIKKIAEAMAKKKDKAVQKWEKIKNQAQMIADGDGTPATKLQQIQKLYSGKTKNRATEKHYVVATKSGRTFSGARKANTRVKMVDKVMKKEKRADKSRVRKGGKGKNGSTSNRKPRNDGRKKK